MFRKASMIMPLACLLAFFICLPAARASADLKPRPRDTSIGRYANAQKHGIWKTYDSKGRVVKKEKYKAGVLVYYIIYNEKHKIIETRDRKGRVRKYEPCNC